jgi:autotransporter-associated beta strand protein
VSGAEVGWDLDAQNNGRTFFRTTLGAGYAADDAGTYQVSAPAGGIFAGLSAFGFSNGSTFTGLDGQTYNVAFPDVLTAPSGSAVALAYSGGTGGAAAIQRAGTGGRGSVVLAGFPFETITQPAVRTAVMERVLGFFALVPDVPITVAAGVTVTDAVTRSGVMRLVKRGAGRLVVDRANTYTGGTVVEAGELVIRHLGAVGSGGIEVRDGARLTIDGGFGRVAVASLALAAGGRIDVGTGGLVVAAGGFGVAEVRQRLAAAGSQGDWAGSSTGIGSTAAGPGSRRAVGMLVQADGSLLVSYAAPGDLNLDGIVDIIDVAAMLSAAMFDTGREADWSQGDVNYDGVVDLLDLGETLGAGLFDGGSYLG